MYYLGNSDQREVRVKHRCIFLLVIFNPRLEISSTWWANLLIFTVEWYFVVWIKLNVLGCSAHRLLGCFWDCLIMLDSYFCLFCPLKWPGKMEPQLKNYLHQICLWDSIFSRIDCYGRVPPVVEYYFINWARLFTFVYDADCLTVERGVTFVCASSV